MISEPVDPSPSAGTDSAKPGTKDELARRLAREMGLSEQELLERLARPVATAPAPPPASAPWPEPDVADAPAGAARADSGVPGGLRPGVVVRRVLVPVKPGEPPPPEVRIITHARQVPGRRDLDSRLGRTTPEPAPAAAPVAPGERDRRARWRELWERLRLIPAWTFSILLHLFLMWLMMGMIVYEYVVKEQVFSVYLGFPGGVKGHQEKGAKGNENDDPPEVEDQPVAEVAAPAPQPDPMPEREPVIAQGPSEPSTQPGGGSLPTEVSGRGGSGKDDLIGKYGGSEFSEQAVLAGLRWLAKHQDPSGMWSGARWETRCPADDRCGGIAEDEYTAGLTGLAMLAFLGAGNTHKDGEFADNVRRALNWLRRLQTPEGLFDEPLRRNMYNHSVCTLAVCEAYAMTQNAEIGRMAGQAITYISRAQQPGGGWDYTDFQTDRNDLSIAGWCIMALKSAKLSGLPVSWETWDRAKQALLKASTPDGRLKYADKAPHAGRLGDGLTAVGMLCRYYFEVEDKLTMDRASRHLLANPPLWRKLKTPSTDSTFYYWYYGTLAMFQRGGKDWERWNASLRDMLIRNQRKDGHAAGSWDPDDAWIGPYAGRLYSTSLNILNLEIYYRYLPLYMMEKTEGARPPQRKAGDDLNAVGEITNDKPKNPETLLLDLEARDTLTRWKAARALADLGYRKAIPVLEGMIPGLDATSRAMFLEVLGRFMDPDTAGFLASYLEDPNDRVREAALKALQKLTGSRTAEQVRDWLERHPK